MFEFILDGFFVLGAVAILTMLGIGIRNKVRGRDNGDWHDDPKAGDPPRITPGNGPNPGAWG